MKIFLPLLVLLVPLTTARAADEPKTVEPLKTIGLSAWREPTGTWAVVGDVSLDPANPAHLTWPKQGTGIIVNNASGPTKDLFTKEEFGDVEIHVEFLIAKKSNSGVYLMGRYELQIYDSFGVEKDEYPGIECGGIYPRWIDGKGVGGHSPAVNASLPAGRWQTFDITFHAPRFDPAGKKIADAEFVKVLHNGKLVHHDVPVTGPTRAAAFNDERPRGPLMLQGDHGPVAFRNIRIRELSRNPG